MHELRQWKGVIRALIIFAFIHSSRSQQQPSNPAVNPSNPLNPGGGGISPGGANAFTIPDSPLYFYGEWRTGDNSLVWRDAIMSQSEQLAGTTIDLTRMFPYYGGLYNYTRISMHGNIAFANLNRQGQDFRVGPSETQWPKETDPALMGLYLCQQQVLNPGIQMRYNDMPNVHFRLVLRTDMTSNDQKRQCQLSVQTGERCYVQSSDEGDRFLNKAMYDLRQGIVGAPSFQADAALVVTWRNMMPNTANTWEARRASTYQMVWLTDRGNVLSYVIVNYDQLGFAANDVQNNAKMGRCRALFNGGNATGNVYVDPTVATKWNPTVLATLSGVPDIVRGRYMFRVDDIVRRGGCSNKTQGTVPLLIAPNIASMLGGVSVDVNGKCWMNPSESFNLYVSERGAAPCTRINAAIARCQVPRVQDWGTKEVYFQSEKSEDRAYIGFMYFVPPGIDPMSLEIGAVYEWFENPPKARHTISWYPKNFTNPQFLYGIQQYQISQQNMNDMYKTDLELYVIGYKEATDLRMRKIVPQHRVLAKIARVTNNPDYIKQSLVLDLSNLGNDIWMISPQERLETLHTYRFGYLKLAPPADPSISGGMQYNGNVDTLGAGIISYPIAIHWLWTLDRSQYNSEEAIKNAIQGISQGMCLEWYNEDGNQDNFIRDTERNASCPCKVDQARADIGRFMPHPRCSKLFRSQLCTLHLGSTDCFISSQNVYGSNERGQRGGVGGTFMTHYGQVCCYDIEGYLMHTSYQPVIQTARGNAQVPYNPGFPQRAYEFGTKPYYGQFEVPTLSGMHNDVMPYYMCCKWIKNRCQLFYWRRPSSGCQQYKPPAVGRIVGAGHFVGLEGRQFTFNAPGIFTLLHIPATLNTKELNIQVRLEQYPNRTVDFSRGNVPQQDLVQPTAATVVTGIAIQEDGSDRVQIMTRKDTRRFKYRTNVVVNGVLRYFDTMWLQRYQGVMIYVNTIAGGQSEIYVVLERPQIGLRIRESYAEDIQTPKGNPESKGILDVAVSVSPEYGVISDYWQQQQQQNLNNQNPNDPFRPFVSGLIRPYPTQQGNVSPQDRIPHTATDAPALISSYMVANLKGGLVTSPDGSTRTNLFRVVTPNHADESVWPAKALVEEPVYAFAPRPFGEQQFTMIQDQTLDQILRECDQVGQQSVNFGNQGTNIQPLYPGTQLSFINGVKCVVGESSVFMVCGNFQPCRYDYGLLYQENIAKDTVEAYNAFLENRQFAVQHYNSCAAMNIEFPEYLMMQPATGPKYLEGNSIRFNCFQDHWVKGDTEYTCYKRYYDNNHYIMEWNHGWQPWCRSKVRADVFKWLAAICGILMILAILTGIFLCCWCMKKRRLQDSAGQKYRTGEPRNIYNHPPPAPMSKDYAMSEKIPVVENEPKKMVVSLHNPRNPGYNKESQLTYDVFPHPNGREMTNQPVSRRSTGNGQIPPPVYHSNSSTPDRSQDSLKGLTSAV